MNNSFTLWLIYTKGIELNVCRQLTRKRISFLFSLLPSTTTTLGAQQLLSMHMMWFFIIKLVHIYFLRYPSVRLYVFASVASVRLSVYLNLFALPQILAWYWIEYLVFSLVFKFYIMWSFLLLCKIFSKRIL